MFTLNWFRKNKPEETTKLENLYKDINDKYFLLIEKLLNKPEEKPEIVKDKNPSVRYNGETISVTFKDGTCIEKLNANIDDWNKFKETVNLSDIKSIENFILSNSILDIRNEINSKISENKFINSSIKILSKNNDFEEKGGSFYLKGINRSIPELLLCKFAELTAKILDFEENDGSDFDIDDEYNDEYNEVLDSLRNEYDGLKKFWMKCCLNPNARSAEDLYEFLQAHKFKIDKHGNFYAYRKVQSVGVTDKSIVEFVSNTYNKVKAIWKKKPSMFTVYKKDDGSLNITDNVYTHGFQSKNNEVIGNLEELYNNLPSEISNRYTDSHSRTMDYRVGEISSIPRHKGNDDNTISCSRGLHLASKQYNYDGFGDTYVLAISSPYDVLAVPKNEVGKLRVCRWFFAAVLSNEERYILDEDDFSVLELGDKFEEMMIEEIDNHIKNGFTEEVKRHTFSIPSITSTEIEDIIEELKATTSVRVFNI